MGRKKTNKTEEFTDSDEFQLYKKLTDEMFDTKNKIESSVVSSTIDTLMKDSAIVAVHQSIREPSIIMNQDLLNIPSAFEDGIKSISYVINGPGIKKIGNAAQNGRNQWLNVGVGKLTPGKSSDDFTTANKIGLGLKMGGYLVPRPSFPYGLFKWKKYEELFYQCIDYYIADYESSYNSTMEKAEQAYLGNLLESWYLQGENDPESPFKDQISRKAFNERKDAVAYLDELKGRCMEFHGIDEDDLPDYFGGSIADKSVTEKRTRIKLFVVYHFKFERDPEMLMNYVEIMNTNRDHFLIRAKAQVPDPEDTEAILQRFSLKLTFDRIPTTDEIENARNKQIEAEWSAGVRKMANEAGIKTAVETMYEIQETLKEQVSSNWHVLILENLKDAFQDALNKVRKGSNDTINYLSVQSLLGKRGDNPTLGILDQLLNISADMKIGDQNLKDVLEDLKNTVQNDDPKVVSKELELAIKDISKEIKKSFGEDIPDQSVNLFEDIPLSEIDEEITIEEDPNEDFIDLF